MFLASVILFNHINHEACMVLSFDTQPPFDGNTDLNNSTEHMLYNTSDLLNTLRTGDANLRC